MPGDRQTGTVAKWLNHKGIGFITPEGCEEGKEDILVHFSQLKQESGDGFKSLEQGSIVEYTLTEDPKNSEKKIATDVTGKDGADCTARVFKTPKPEKVEKAEGEEESEEGKGKGKGKGKKGKGKGKKGKGKGKKGKGKGKKGQSEDDE